MQVNRRKPTRDVGPGLAPGFLVLACALAGIASARVHANGTPETFAPDARTLALTHADAADVQGAALAHTNPAAPASARTPRFFASYSLSVPFLGVELAEPLDDDEAALSPARPTPVPGLAMGAVIPLDIVVPDRLAFAFYGYFPSLVLIRARAHDPARPFFYRYDSATEHYDISTSLSLRVFDWLFVGAGARLTAGQSGNIDLAVDLVRGRIDRQVADTYQYAVFSPQAGALVGPLGVEHIAMARVGLVWREATEFDVKLPASLDIEGADVAALLDILIQSNYSPRLVSLGTSVDVIDHITANIDVEYVFWSQAPPPFLKARVDLSGSGLEDAGLDETLDAPAKGEERVVAPGFEDTLVLKAGIEGRILADALALRCGYQLRPTPVPDQTTGTNIIDSRAHIIGAGVGVRAWLPALVDRPVDFDLGYQAQILEPRKTEKDAANDPVGDWTAGGIVHAVAFGLTYVW